MRKYEIYNVDGWCYMANIKDCPGFETFGADVKEARKVKQLSRKTLAEQVKIDWRYLAGFPWNGILTQRSCGRKAHCGSGSATS